MNTVGLHQITNVVLKGIDLELHAGELVVLLGPSGAGKTTLLNVIAGLVPYRGRVNFGGRPADNLPPHKRRVGYVFQDLLLFPHLTVEKNLLLAMKHLDLNRGEKHDRTGKILDLFRVGHLSERLPGQLSGGEKQRVALARAAATGPKVLLLDEPFASLDFRTARYLRQEFKRLQRRLGLTTLFVTHDLHEARDLADRITVLRYGRLEQTLRPDELWDSGGHDDDFLEKPNLLACRNPVRLDNGLIEVLWAGLKILVPDEGEPFTHVAILPEDVFISPLPPPGPPINRFFGTVREIMDDDGEVRVTVQVVRETLRATMNQDHRKAMNLHPGVKVHGILKLRALRGVTRLPA